MKAVFFRKEAAGLKMREGLKKSEPLLNNSEFSLFKLYVEIFFCIV